MEIEQQYKLFTAKYGNAIRLFKKSITCVHNQSTENRINKFRSISKI